MSYSRVRVGDICAVNKSSYSQKEKWKYVNYLDTGNITNNRIDEIQYIDLITEKLPSRAKRKVKHNSIIISTVRPNQLHYGIIKSQPENFLVSTGFAVIDVMDDTLDADYLYYVLTQKEIVAHLHAIAEQSTSAYPAIKPSDIQDLEILIPDLKAQKKIASLLISIDNRISINTKINENLEQQAQAIFKSWFVDFEPFGGVMPDDWQIGMLSEIAEISSGKRPPMRQADKTDNVYIPLVGAASVMGYTNESNHRDKILVIGRVGTHGIVQRFNVPCWTSDNTLVITSPYYEYTYQVLKQIDYTAMNRGSTQPLITQGDMNKAEILLPDEELILKYERLVGILFAQHEHNRSENVYLANLRDTLLPKLMNGEIDVSQVQI